MKIRLLTGVLGGAVIFGPMVSADTAKKATTAQKKEVMSQDMREAIAFERHKEEAAARQARIEARHPSVSQSNAVRSANSGRDSKAPGKLP